MLAYRAEYSGRGAVGGGGGRGNSLYTALEKTKQKGAYNMPTANIVIACNFHRIDMFNFHTSWIGRTMIHTSSAMLMPECTYANAFMSIHVPVDSPSPGGC